MGTSPHLCMLLPFTAHRRHPLCVFVGCVVVTGFSMTAFESSATSGGPLTDWLRGVACVSSDGVWKAVASGHKSDTDRPAAVSMLFSPCSDSFTGSISRGDIRSDIKVR